MFRRAGLVGVFIVVIGFVYKVEAQQVQGTKRFHLTWARLQNEDPYRTLFRLLASNNGKNIQSELLDISFDYTVSFTKNREGQVGVEYAFYNKRVVGDVYFRDFKIDSLLLPDSLLLEITFVNGLKRVALYDVPVSFDGGRVVLEKKLPFTVKPLVGFKEILYSLEKEKGFVEQTNGINHYYGYSLLHDQMVDYYQKINLKSFYLPSEVFASLFALQRLRDFTAEHHFVELLHLNRNDPEHLKNKMGQAARLLKREETIYLQQLNQPPPPGDCDAFITQFSRLSMKALEEAGRLQPYRAESFKAYAAINRSEQTIRRLNNIRRYYEKTGQCTDFTQRLFDAYVRLAEQKLQQQAYVEGMIFTDNATFLLRSFHEIVRTAAFLNTDARLHDGLMDSFLSVAVSAFKVGNQKMFSEYYGKALTILTDYINDTSVLQTRFVFPKFRDHLFSLARSSTADPDRGLRYMHYAVLANAGRKNLPEIDSMYAVLYRTALERMIKHSEQLLAQGHPLQAKNQIDEANEYILSKKHYLSGFHSRLIAAAYPVYLEILQQSQIAFDRGDANRFFLMSKAREMEDRYFDFHSKDLDNMIAADFISEAKKKLKKAEFELWADHPDNTLRIINEVKEQQHRYGIVHNGEINAKLAMLEKKLGEKQCDKLQKEVENRVSVVTSHLNRNNLEKATVAYRKLLDISKKRGNCRLQLASVEHLQSTYGALFEFYQKQKALNKKIFKEGFRSALPDYAALDREFYKKEIRRYGQHYTPLYEFVQSQHSKELAKDALSFFIEMRNGVEAFRYLDLLQRFRVPPQEVKSYQKRLARLFKAKNLIPPQWVAKDNWYATFRLFYSGKISGNIPLFRD